MLCSTVPTKLTKIGIHRIIMNRLTVIWKIQIFNDDFQKKKYTRWRFKSLTCFIHRHPPKSPTHLIRIAITLHITIIILYVFMRTVLIRVISTIAFETILKIINYVNSVKFNSMYIWIQQDCSWRRFELSKYGSRLVFTSELVTT